MTAPCIVLLGGSFDPVHEGHIAVADFFCRLLKADELRLIPAGNPWQKGGLKATSQQRIDMLRLAFEDTELPARIDLQEIERPGASYTIDTLQSLRGELGPEASLVFLMGSDQLMQLDTWRDWRHLFDYAHICVAARPGFSHFASQLLPGAVAQEFSRRAGSPEQIRNTPSGLAYMARELAFDISATEIRDALYRGKRPGSLVPAAVLDYIEKNNIYKE